MAREKKEKSSEPLEKQLWIAADKLRKNIDAAEYKNVVLGLIFLKYISDSFDELFALLNLATRGIDGSRVKWNSEGSFLNDSQPARQALSEYPYSVSPVVSGP